MPLMQGPADSEHGGALKLIARVQEIQNQYATLSIETDRCCFHIVKQLL